MKLLVAMGLSLALLAPVSVSTGQGVPKIRQLGPVLTRSVPTVQSIAVARELPHGRVLVNDIAARRVYLFDSALTGAAVVLDSVMGGTNSYGDTPGGMIPYRGDSTLFVDPSSISMLVLSPTGAVRRVMAGPRIADMPLLVGGPFGTPGFDSKGRLVWRGSARDPNAVRPKGSFSPPPELDSAPILAFDMTSRKIDTLGRFRKPVLVYKLSPGSDGRLHGTTKRIPIPQVDDWAILPDGTLAIVRGADFHIDWIRTDGTRFSTSKLPFPWQRLSDERKKELMDSVRFVTDTARANQNARILARFQGNEANAPQVPESEYPSPSELPDYMPPFAVNSTHSDLNGILWIKTSEIVAGQAVYYLVNQEGKLIDRVQIPRGRVIAGFGANDTVYLAYIDPKGGVRLERTRVH